MLRLGFSEPEIPLYVVRSGDRLEPEPGPELVPARGADVDLRQAAAAEPSGQTAVVADSPVKPAVRPDAPTPDKPAAQASTTDAEPVKLQSATTDAAKPARVDRTGTIIASAPPPPPDSTLALVWEPGVIERLPPQEKKKPEYDVVALSSLKEYLGKRVQLVTVNGKRVDGEMNAVESGNIVLLVQVGRGSAKLNVPVSNIREARLLRSR